MKKLVVCLLFVVIFLSACTDSGVMEQNSVVWADVYYRSESKTIGSEPFAIPLENNTKKMMTKALNQMSENPVATDLSPALPEGTEALDINIKDGNVTVNFSEEFLLLKGVEKTIASTCVFKTLANFTNIKTLDITVAEVLQTSQFDKDAAALNSPLVYSGSKEIEVYLYNRKGELTKTKIKVELKDGNLPEKLALDTLMSGSSSYTSPIPEHCAVNSISVSAGLCKIDFSEELLTCPEEMAEDMVAAIVLTETSIEYIDRVKITVNGEAVRGFEKINLAREFKNENFVKEE